MSGEIEQALWEQFHGAGDAGTVSRLVEVAARGRAIEAHAAAVRAEVEAVIYAEIADLSVRDAAQVLGMSPRPATRARRSYRRAAEMYPSLADLDIGQRLHLANWPEDDDTIRDVIEARVWPTS